jgi:hypothetical protein
MAVVVGRNQRFDVPRARGWQRQQSRRQRRYRAFCRGVTSVTARDCGVNLIYRVVPFRETAEVNKCTSPICVKTKDYEIMDRRSRLHLSLWFPDESVWIVPGTVSADD